jgi:hypothetical protein
MTFAVTSPITGAAQTGLTSPTFTLTADTAPGNSKQWAVTTVGGTQTGVLPHSLGLPFTISCFKPLAIKQLGRANVVTGVINTVPRNVFKVITRKGVLPLAGQPATNLQITTVIELPAGSDTADPVSVRSALSAHLGALAQQAAGLGDTVVSGIL